MTNNHVIAKSTTEKQLYSFINCEQETYKCNSESHVKGSALLTLE